MTNTIRVFDSVHREIPIQTIKYVEGHESYSMLYLTDSKPILASYNVSKMAGQLPSFVRIYRKYLVNPQFIAPNQLLSVKQLMLSLTTGEVLPISRRRVTELASFLAKSKE